MARKKRKTPTKKSDIKKKIKQQEGLGDLEYVMDPVFAKDPKKRPYLLMDKDMLDMTSARQKRFREMDKYGADVKSAATTLSKERRDKKRRKKEKELTPPMETTEGKFVEPSLLRKLQLKGSGINRKIDDLLGTVTTKYSRKKGGKISEGTKFVARQYGGKIGK
jgi:hypothetical protein